MRSYGREVRLSDCIVGGDSTVCVMHGCVAGAAPPWQSPFCTFCGNRDVPDVSTPDFAVVVLMMGMRLEVSWLGLGFSEAES